MAFSLTHSLRLVVITDRTLAEPRSVLTVVDAALAAGAPAIQIRDKLASARETAELAAELLRRTRPHGALLVINDRADVAIATGADGVHLGPDDLPVARIRECAPPGFLIGCSTDDPSRAREAEAEGASYIGCGAVWSTGTKDVGGEAIGLERLSEVVRATRLPVVAIGGITPGRARRLPATGAAGCAVVSAVMRAEDPGSAVRALLEPWDRKG